MKYQVNIKFELENIPVDERLKLHKKLADLGWIKKEVDATWACWFKESVSRYNASRLLLIDIEKAKRFSGLKEIEYKIQMEHINILAGVV